MTCSDSAPECVQDASTSAPASAAPPLEIARDIDHYTGNIDTDRDVIVRGSILDLFQVSVGGNLTVEKMVEAATVRCKGNLTVNGGVLGKDKGIYWVGGNLHARCLSNAHIEVEGDIAVKAEIRNCNIRCGGKLVIQSGSLFAGHVSAIGGICCNTLGCPSALPTVVEAGCDHAFFQLVQGSIAQIHQVSQKVARTRGLVEPLMRNQKALTAQQKERATELLFQAGELAEQIAGKMAELKRGYDRILTNGRGEISVSGVLHPGVVIRFPAMEAVVAGTVRGPVQIVPQCDNSQKRIVIVSSAGPTTPLATRISGENPMDLLRKLFDHAAVQQP